MIRALFTEQVSGRRVVRYVVGLLSGGVDLTRCLKSWID